MKNASKAMTAKSSVKKPAASRGAKQGGQPKADGTVTWNIKLLSHNLLGGFGGMGEGMSIQIAPDGRRIMWLAHESAPKNFTAVDVSDPRKPKVICQTDLPQSHMRSNSLETCGNIMAVAYQTQKKGLQPAGMELFDILHVGHSRYLRDARALGDVLIVGVNSDASVKTLGKGDDRPIQTEEDRAELLSHLAAVDFVILFDEHTPE